MPAIVKSWSEWFDENAKIIKDPRLKMAYQVNGKAVHCSVIKNTIKDVSDKLNLADGLTLLDIGGGIGLFSKFYKFNFKYVVTSDISFNMVKEESKQNPKSIFIRSNITHLPLKDESFDRLLCYSIFHYLKDLDHATKIIKEFLRVVSINGMILIGDISFLRKNTTIK